MSRPSSPTRARRPTLTSSSAPRTDVPSSSRTTTSSPSPSRDTCTALAPVRTVTPSSRSAAATTSPASGSSGGRMPVERLDDGHRRAVPREHLGQLERRSRRRRGRRATRAPSVAEIASRLVQYRVSARPSIGGTTGADPVATTTPRARDEGVVADDHPAGPVQPGRAADQPAALAGRTGRRRPCRPSRRWPRPGSAWRRAPRSGSIELRPAYASARRVSAISVDAADHHLARHAAPVRALAADQLALDADDGQPGLGQPAGHLLAARPHPDHHDVDVRVRHESILPRWVACGCDEPRSADVPAVAGAARRDRVERERAAHQPHRPGPHRGRASRRARSVAASSRAPSFARVLTSPLLRARRTAELAGYGAAEVAGRPARSGTTATTRGSPRRRSASPGPAGRCGRTARPAARRLRTSPRGPTG